MTSAVRVAPLAQPLALTELTVLRLVRSYGVTWAWGRRAPWTVLLAVPALALVAGAAGGALAATRPTVDPRAIVVGAALVATALLVGTSTPARNLTAALASPRSWHLVQQAGVTPAAFAAGRFTLPVGWKAANVLLALTGFMAGFLATVLSGSTAGPADRSGMLAGLGLTLLVAAGAALRIAVGVAAATTLRTGGDWARAGRRGGLALAVAAAVAAAVAVVAVRLRSAAAGSRSTEELLGTVGAALDTPAGVMAGLVALGAASGAAVHATARLRRLTWPEVLDVALERSPARVAAPALPTSPWTAVVVTDLRRLTRSAGLRLRGIGTVLVLYALVAAVAGLAGLTHTEIPSPADMPDGVLGPMLVGVLTYGILIAAGALTALDSDRHALVLWRTVGSGLDRVAMVRAAELAVLGTAMSIAFTPAVLAVTPAGGSVLSCLLAGGVLSVAAGSGETLASLVWPRLDWNEATEIGTTHPGRMAVGWVVMLPVLPVVLLARLVDIDLGVLAGLALAGLVLLAAPTLAALVVRAAVLLARRYSRA